MPKEPRTPVDHLAPARISRFAFGIRYEPQYVLAGLLGAVVDQVLRKKGTPFGPDTFPFSETGATAYRLTDGEERALRLSTHDTVLQFPLNASSFSRLEQLGEHFQEFVLEPLRSAGLTNITRFGVLLHLTSLQEQCAVDPVRTYLGAESDARSLSLRFTRRLPSLGALAKKHVNDFRNAIYSVDQSEKGVVELSLDYQEYFDPALDGPDWAARPFPAAVSRAIDYSDRELRLWLERLGKATQAA